MPGGSHEQDIAAGEGSFAVTRTSSPDGSTPDDAAATATGSQRPLAPLQLRDAGRYERLSEHGRGGLGRVMRAHDKELGRDVAIKELLDRGNASELRFYREALITARLEHPGIVPVHEAGRWADGTPFYAMKLVAGRPLREVVDAAHGLADRLALLGNVIAVADAIAYAHDRRVIHRDLKPANVIVGEFGETVVIDWGLAKRLDAPIDDDTDSADPAARQRLAGSSDLTLAGSIVGTPAYMAPEQLAGRADERSDIYALGGILLHVLSGAPPRRSAPGALRGIPRDLAAIVARAMATDPAQRYATAQAFADDLRRFQRRAPVAARRYSLPARLALGIARYRALALAFVGALIVLAIVLAISLSKIAGARDELVLQNAELLMRSDPTAAAAALAGYRGGNAIRRDQLVAEAIGRGVAHRAVTAHGAGVWFVGADPGGALYSISEDQTLRRTVGDTATTLARDVASSAVVAYAPAHRLLAYVRAPAGIALFDLSTRQSTAIETGTPAVIAFSPGETRLAELSSSGRLRVWHLAAGSPPAPLLDTTIAEANDVVFAGDHSVLVMDGHAIHALAIDEPGGARSPAAGVTASQTSPANRAAASHPSLALRAAPTAFAVDPSGEHIAVGDAVGGITLATSTLATGATLAVCLKRITAVVFVPHTDVIGYACRDGVVGIARRTAAGLVAVDSFTTTGAALTVQADPSGRYLVSCDESNTVLVYGSETRMVTRYVGHAARITYLASPAPDLPYFVAGDSSGAYRLWPPPDRAVRVAFQVDYAVGSLRFAPDGRRLVAAGVGGAARSLDLQTRTVTAFVGHTDQVRAASFMPDSDRVVTASDDGTVRVWRSDGTELAVFRGHGGSVAVVESADDAHVVSAGDDGRLLLWPVDAPRYVELLRGHAPLTYLRVLTAPTRFIVADAQGAVSAAALDGRVREIRPAGHVVTALRASRDGTRVAVGDDDGSVAVYETAGWRVVAAGRASAAVYALQFDRSGHVVVFAAADGHVHTLVLDGANPFTWSDLALRVHDVQFSPDGRVLALVVGAGGAIWLYEISARRWHYVQDHQNRVTAGAFSPDGRWFASYDGRGVITLRDIDATLAANSR